LLVEVVQRKPYNEKADVYSFSILLWQMAKDKVPFKGFSKEEFIETVVLKNERPKLDKSWPAGFNNLLKQCWDPEPTNRPSFTIIIMEINKLLANEASGLVTPGSTASNTSTPKTSWF
jgi:hypothetical protein